MSDFTEEEFKYKRQMDQGMAGSIMHNIWPGNAFKKHNIVMSLWVWLDKFNYLYLITDTKGEFIK